MAADSNFEALHLEILQEKDSILCEAEVIRIVEKWLESHSLHTLSNNYSKFDDPVLSEHVSSINVEKSGGCQNGKIVKVFHYVYHFNSYIPEIQEADEEQQISTQWILPSQDFHGLWESLIYDGDIKNELISYVSTALQFSEKNIDSNIISWNRIILLHGPPGTGKTSLCKALAQKISIRFSSKFQYGHFVEINTHSLFSKWFSESGKKVTKMFHEILSMLEDPKVLVIVLLDEVESLARSRASALNGNEPSDSLRVVNALLTHLDMIKRYPNVLILTTSNITDAIDVALIDRADIKMYIGLPSVEAIYQIYCTCIKELQKAEIIITGACRQFEDNFEELDIQGNSALRTAKLRNIAQKSVGLSGRSLRKIPFIACSLFIKSSVVRIDDFLDALNFAVEKHWSDVQSLKIHL